MRRSALGAVALAALILSGAALGVGPWPGLARSVTSASGVRYTTARANGMTTVRAIRDGEVVSTTSVDGTFGIPAVTSVGLGGGLSPNGQLLVLTEPPTYDGLRTQSSFALLSTSPLALRDTIALRGDFGFDALSPDGRTLYLLRHTSLAATYEVRAYDLRAKQLLRRVIVAKGESPSMRGYPIARTASQTGAWVYTLYTRQSGKPFVHALDTAHRAAVCIDLPWKATFGQSWQAKLVLTGRTLVVRANGHVVSTIDTKSFRVH